MGPGEAREQCCVTGQARCAPGEGREKGKESRGYCSVSNISWKTFQFLLPAASEGRNKTSYLHNELVQLLPACLGTGNTHVPGTRWLLRAVAERYPKTWVSAGVGNLLASLPKGSEGTPRAPDLPGLLVHTCHKSGCSFSSLRSLMQTAPNRFEKLPRLLGPLPQVRRQMS